LHYLYPIGLPDSLLRAIAEEEKVVPYLDMPLQHASGPMLKAMRRGVTRAGQDRILDRVRRYIPDAALRTTFIVGFPGETDRDFEELVDFVRAQQFDRVGVFTYFQEEGTHAATLPGQVPEAVRLERQAELMRVQAEISRARNEALVGQVHTVLVDGPAEEDDRIPAGRLATQAPDVDGQVLLDEADEDVRPGQFRQVQITAASDYDLVGRVVDEPPAVPSA
jgi:ribosomal protein S12 methylthiotransferase